MRTLSFTLAWLLLAGWVSANAQDKTTDLAIVVGKGCTFDGFTSAELVKIFRGEKSKDPDGHHFVLVGMANHTPEFSAILAGVYNLDEDGYAKYFLQATFTAVVAVPPRQFTSSTALRQFVATTTGAISYLRASDADDSVKVLKVDGKLPGEPGYRLKIK
jgi:hypothetical protein